MGGMKGGSTASGIAVKTVLNDVMSASADESPAEVLKEAIKHANSEIIKASSIDCELAGMGTTLTAIILNDECATVSYVGDSRVYQLRGKQKVFRTFDHSMVFQSVRQGIITEEQARLSSQSNIILQALGIKEELEVEVYELPYLAGDRFLLCTDGFWGAMPEKELIRLIAKGKVPEVLKKAALKIDLLGIRQGGQHDNLTAAMFDVKKESKKKAKMTFKNKILFAIIILLLISSVLMNIRQFMGCASTEEQTAGQQEQEVVIKNDSISVKTDTLNVAVPSTEITKTK
jgi:protein phosphatase